MKRITMFLIILLIPTFFAAVYTQKVSATVSISQLSPAQGPVETAVSLIGQITTANGTYKIFFDDKEVGNGTATNTDVLDTFTVPNSTFGDHLVKLHDVAINENNTALFTVQTKYVVKALAPPLPRQLQEGANLTINVVVTGGNASTLANVTLVIENPANVTHSSNVTVSVGANGYGETNSTYPAGFDASPHTFYVGVYNVSLKRLDNIVATGSFTVGLTNATEYHRFQTVNVKALNYTTTDVLKIAITYGDKTVYETSPNNASEPGGIITANWAIPANASMGVYRVAVLNTTTPLSTVKPVPDNQAFSIVSKSFASEVKTFNLDNEPVPGVVLEANNTVTSTVTRRTTSEDGLASFTLEASNYAFTAFLNNSRVGSAPEIGLAGNLTGTAAIRINCSLANIKIAARHQDDVNLPFVGVVANFTYTTRTNTTITKTAITETDLTGIGTLRNLFININYTIRMTRYGATFATTTLNLTSTRWFNATCPTLELIVRTLDRNGSPLQNAHVNVTDWGIGLSGLVGEADTGTSGEVGFNLTFGKYLVRVYKGGFLLNETSTILVNLTHATTFAVYCRLYNLTLNISIVDYLGQGIPNANVTIEREGTILDSSTTGGDGVAHFTELVGGNYRILVYVGERPYGITALRLQDPETVVLKLGELVSIGGFLTETGAFITITLIVLLIIVFILAIIYRRLRSKQKEE
jgi:hypothetical protein